MFTLHSQPKTTVKKRKRLGRGEGSGVGKNAGRGHKGQVKRSGKLPVTFEGGMRSLMKRTPKIKGFKINIGRETTAVLSLGRINNSYNDGDTVSIETLKTKGLIDTKIKKVRIVNSGEYSNKLTFADESALYLTKGVQDVIK